jgi:putative Mg2+ transporter-C (MgtC) family protein
MITDRDFILRLAVAFALGSLIGLERQFRHRGAGLRTNALVAAGACMFVSLSFLYEDASPSRIAAGVVTGIGFLGAGVILREGLSVRGLTTAATIWCSAAIGCLAGTGRWQLALYGSVFVFLANLLLRPVSEFIDRLPFGGDDRDTGGE